jgi:hypothetical protein
MTVISQQKYYINSSTGNDTTGNGSNTAPYKTLQKISDVARYNIFKPNPSPLTIEVAGDCPSSDVLSLDFTEAANRSFLLKGTPSFIRSGTITATTLINRGRGTSALATLTDSGVTSWTADLASTGRQLRLTSGSFANIWIKSDLGSGTAMVTSNGPIEIGDTYEIVKLNKIYIGNIDIKNMSGGPDNIFCNFEDAQLLGATNAVLTNISAQAAKTFTNIFFDGITYQEIPYVDSSTQQASWFINCYCNKMASFRDGFISGGLYQGMRSLVGSKLVLTNDVIITNEGLLCLPNSYTIANSVGTFSDSESGITIAPGAIVAYDPDPEEKNELFGQNVEVGMNVQAGGHFIYEGDGSKFTMTGTEGDLELGGLKTVPPIDKDTFAIGTPTPLTWESLQTDFGGSVINQANKAAITKMEVYY